MSVWVDIVSCGMVLASKVGESGGWPGSIDEVILVVLWWCLEVF